MAAWCRSQTAPFLLPHETAGHSRTAQLQMPQKGAPSRKTVPRRCATSPREPASQQRARTALRYSYEWPKLTGPQTDYIAHISAPGRTLGRGAGGHADLLGNNFELTSTVSFTAAYAASGGVPFEARHRWSGNGSWEVHGYNRGGGSTTFLLNKYGKLGLRCAKP